MPTAHPQSLLWGRRREGGHGGAEPMEVLKPDGQVSGYFTQPHVAGAMCRLAVFS